MFQAEEQQVKGQRWEGLRLFQEQIGGWLEPGALWWKGNLCCYYNV